MNKHFKCSNCKKIIKYTAKNGFICGGEVKKIAYKNDRYRLCFKNDTLVEKHCLDMNRFDLDKFQKIISCLLIAEDIYLKK